MKTELRKVYECEHCGRKMMSAGAMGYHEKWCKKNPHNRHQCFKLCQFLERKTVVDWSDGDSGHYHHEFVCLKTKQPMYSYHLEKRHHYSFRSLPCDAVRMPLKCDMFQEMSYDEQCKRFDL